MKSPPYQPRRAATGARFTVDRKKLLFLSPLYPLPVASGGQARALNLIARLARRFDVTLLTLLSGPGRVPQLDELRSHCSRIVPVVPSNKRSPLHRAFYKVIYWIRRLTMADCPDRFYTMMPSVRRAIRRELQERRYDVLFFSYWFWSPWEFAAPGLKVIDTCDVQAERIGKALEKSRNPLERLLKGRLLSRYSRWEAEMLNRADVVIATTARDREVFKGLTDGHTEHIVVPAGVDTDYFSPRREPADLRSVVFYGALHNPMNVDAVQHLVEDILPRIRARVPGVRLTIVGSSPTSVHRITAGHPDVALTGYVADPRQSLGRAGVVVLPLRYTHGTRVRVFELLGMAVPVVATSVAVAGMDLAEGDGLLLADGPDAFADAVARVLHDSQLRADLARRGRELALSRLSLEATYDRLAEMLELRVATTLARQVS